MNGLRKSEKGFTLIELMATLVDDLSKFSVFLPSGDMNTFMLVQGSKTPPQAAPLAGDGAASPAGPSVDPCYEGSFIYNIAERVMYKVVEDGKLEAIGIDPTRASVEAFGYDIWKDSLYYLYPDGVLVDYPETSPYIPPPA